MHRSSVFSFCPLPPFSLSVTKPQVVPVSWVLFQMWLFSLAPYFWRTVALTHFSPLWEGLTEQWPNVGCTQEHLLDPAAAGALHCSQVPAHPRKSSRDSVAAAFQGLQKITTHIWHPIVLEVCDWFIFIYNHTMLTFAPWCYVSERQILWTTWGSILTICCNINNGLTREYWNPCSLFSWNLRMHLFASWHIDLWSLWQYNQWTYSCICNIFDHFSWLYLN